MANYNIVVDTSNFKPFDMSFTMGILNAYKEQYHRYEDALNKIAEESGMLNLPTPEEGNEQLLKIFDMYNKYNEDFRNISDDFAMGMTYKNAPLVMALNRRYGSEVKPIKQAFEDFKKFKENKNTLRANKDNIYFAKDPSVYDFMGGNIPDLVTINGAKVQEEALKVIGNLYSGPLAKDPEFKSLVLGWYTMVENGYDPKATLDDYILDYENRHGSDLTNEFKKALNFIYDSYNLGDNWGEDEKKAIWGDVIKGAISGLPKRTNTNIQDRNFESDADRETRLLNARLAISKDKREAEMHPLDMANKRASIAYTNAQTYALKHPQKSTSSTSFSSQFNDLIAYYQLMAAFGTPELQELAREILKNIAEVKDIGKDPKKGNVPQAVLTGKDNSIYKTTMYLPAGVMTTTDGKPNKRLKLTIKFNVRNGQIVGIDDLGDIPADLDPYQVRQFFSNNGTAQQYGMFDVLDLGGLALPNGSAILESEKLPLGYQGMTVTLTPDYENFVDRMMAKIVEGRLEDMKESHKNFINKNFPNLKNPNRSNTSNNNQPGGTTPPLRAGKR